MSKVKVKLTKTLTAVVEIDSPEVADEIDWYDEVERLAWERQAQTGTWDDEDDADIIEGEWSKPTMTDTVTTAYGSTHPTVAEVNIGQFGFVCEDEADWMQCVPTALYGVPIDPDDEIWIRAARQFVRLIHCSCGQPLDPDDADATGCHLCPACYLRSGWENTHSDHDHEHSPDSDCPLCQEKVAEWVAWMNAGRPLGGAPR